MGDGWTEADHIASIALELSHATFRAVSGLGGVEIPPLIIERPGVTEPEEPEPEPPKRNDVDAFTAALFAAKPV